LFAIVMFAPFGCVSSAICNRFGTGRDPTSDANLMVGRATPTQARAMLGLKGADRVKF